MLPSTICSQGVGDPGLRTAICQVLTPTQFNYAITGNHFDKLYPPSFPSRPLFSAVWELPFLFFLSNIDIVGGGGGLSSKNSR